MERTLLIIDDEPDLLRLLKRTLASELSCRVETASSGEEALSVLGEERFDLILADIRMPGIDGIELLSRIKSGIPDQTVILMTAHGDIDTAIRAMKEGAYDFITKPFDHEAVVLKLEKAFERIGLLQENIRLQKACCGELEMKMVGRSQAMLRVFDTIKTVASTDVTVLITGESGTGKNMVAQAIHGASLRKKGPFTVVNCPTVPENILESELFGYRKGAFTHASTSRSGLFSEARGGTIFLDEIGEISPSIQTKLLRVLQEKKIKPLGDNREIEVDVRVVASTNQDLPELIKKGQFREDLYYRLNILPIKMPALRERKKDIPLIAGFLVEKHCRKLSRPSKIISPELMDLFTESDWEGNIRELENRVIRGILYSSEDVITPAHAGFTGEINVGRDSGYGYVNNLGYKEAKERVLHDFNHSYVAHVLNSQEGNVTRAARMCGLERQALQQVMKRHGIDAGQYRKKKQD